MPTSIRHIIEKLKPWLADDTLFYTAVVLLVGIASFGLGRQSASLTASVPAPGSPPLTEVVPLVPRAGNQASVGTAITGVVVGSKSGSRYHLPTCPGAAQIKPENLVEFASIAAAEAAGYTPAANCDFN